MESSVQEIENKKPKPRIKKGACLWSSDRADIFQGYFNDTDCAIKIYKKTDRYQRDIDLLRIISPHPTLLTSLYSYIRPDHKMAFNALALMTNGSLLSIINNNSALNKSTSLNILRDILSGLDHLHGFDVVHRDLTAEHILLDDRMKVKITGLGLAKKTSARSEIDPKEQLAMLEYLAPEIAHNAQQYSIKSDIYAFGILLYVLASYQGPYESQRHPSQLSLIKALTCEFKSLNKSLLDDIPPFTSSWVRLLIANCTKETALERPSVSKLISELDEQLLESDNHHAFFANQAYKLQQGLISSIGQGASATVYTAQFNNNPCAIKIFNETVDTNDYLREIEIQKRASQHPNIVKLLSSYMSSRSVRTAFIVFELMNKGSLYSMIQEQTALNETIITAIIRDILHGLDHLHRSGIVHRDIRSSNIVLETVEDTIRAKITDFGLAINLSERCKLEPFLGLGSPDFMAPEMIHNARHCSHQSDIYAFGILLFEIASRRLPYLGKNSMYVQWNVTNHFKEINSLLLNDIPLTALPWLRPLVELCTNEDPSARPLAKEIVTLLPTNPITSDHAGESIQQAERLVIDNSNDDERDLVPSHERQSLSDILEELSAINETKMPATRASHFDPHFFQLASKSSDILSTRSNDRSLGCKSKDAPTIIQIDSKLPRSMNG